MTEFTSAQVGKFGEDYCSKYIKKHKKLKVLGRNVTIGKLEVDIIATNKDYIVFIEVKTRRQEKSNFYRPAHAVDYAKRTNLLNKLSVLSLLIQTTLQLKKLGMKLLQHV